MNFRIADTFTGSLARLSGDEQKAVKITVFDLQANPVNPGMQLHKIEKSRDRNFLSARVSADIRLIVHKTTGSMLLCYVDHHDKAYDWARRRKIETHPSTGAAQFVEIRERVQEIISPGYHEGTLKDAATPLFAAVPDEDLLSYGVPTEWLGDVRAVATEDALLELTNHLPSEAAEALIDIATGKAPASRKPLAIFYRRGASSMPPEPSANVVREAAVSYPKDPFSHPDAQRRFRTIDSVEELERALEFPWDKWTVFLHPAQRELVERDYSGQRWSQ